MSAVPDGPTVYTVGEVMVDVIARVPRFPERATDTPATVADAHGGSGANLAAWLAHFGTRSVLMARVGADAAGDDAIALLREQGVITHVQRDPRLPTGRCLVIVDPSGERTMLPDPGANAALDATDLDIRTARAGDHLHVSAYAFFRESTRPPVLQAMEAARAAGLTVSVDASSAGPLRDVGAGAFLRWCASADLLLANRDEAAVLTGARDPLEAASLLAARHLIAVVKCGSDGAAVASAQTSGSHRAPEARVIDTTGAGDAFGAGFIASWIRDRDIVAALRHGVDAGSRAVRQPGGRP